MNVPWAAQDGVRDTGEAQGGCEGRLVLRGGPRPPDVPEPPRVGPPAAAAAGALRGSLGMLASISSAPLALVGSVD